MKPPKEGVSQNRTASGTASPPNYQLDLKVRNCRCGYSHIPLRPSNAIRRRAPCQRVKKATERQPTARVVGQELETKMATGKIPELKCNSAPPPTCNCIVNVPHPVRQPNSSWERCWLISCIYFNPVLLSKDNRPDLTVRRSFSFRVVWSSFCHGPQR